MMPPIGWLRGTAAFPVTHPWLSMAKAVLSPADKNDPSAVRPRSP
jgi:hypothetical protein